jgi:uncharacterized protein DUF4863
VGQQPIDLERFAQLVAVAADEIGMEPLDKSLEAKLNRKLPPDSAAFQEIFTACREAIKSGWMCQRTVGEIRYGRVIKPSGPLGRFSVDVVETTDVVGPAHAHPNGEIDMTMPLDENAKFDGQGAGRLVYPPGSRHAPTVTRGKALVLYLLPDGAIDFNAAIVQ